MTKDPVQAAGDESMNRVGHGGSWFSDDSNLIVSYRYNNSPRQRFFLVLRVARNAKEK